VARELAPVGWRSRPKRVDTFLQVDRISRFTTAAPPSGSKLPRHELQGSPKHGAGLVVHNKLLTYRDKHYRYDASGRMIEKRSAKRGL
jgi:hypothetical protein